MIKNRMAGRGGVFIESRLDFEPYLDQLIVPHRKAPVLVYSQKSSSPALTEMGFSLIPHWSKEPRVKFATHNARLETVDEKPTWRKVFGRRHCLVPMTDFIEPIYEGEFAGFMVAFSAPGEGLIFAAGIWDEWVNRSTGEVIQSFAIITHEPPPFIADTGHDRCPVFLGESDGAKWLDGEGGEVPALKKLLLDSNQALAFQAEKHRPMKAGWEKRK